MINQLVHYGNKEYYIFLSYPIHERDGEVGAIVWNDARQSISYFTFLNAQPQTIDHINHSWYYTTLFDTLFGGPMAANDQQSTINWIDGFFRRYFP